MKYERTILTFSKNEQFKMLIFLNVPTFEIGRKNVSPSLMIKYAPIETYKRNKVYEIQNGFAKFHLFCISE